MSLYRKVKSYFSPQSDTSLSDYTSPATACEAVFSYAVVLPEADEEQPQVLVTGSFAIKNTGTRPLTRPLACIRVRPTEQVRLGGKIGTLKKQEPLLTAAPVAEWNYVHDNWRERVRQKGEYWLRPVHCPVLVPGDTLLFSGFDLCFTRTDAGGSLLVDGFVYAEEMPTGMTAANSISITF